MPSPGRGAAAPPPACRSCARSRPPHRWPRPRTARERRASRGHRSSAATKCISDVPGFMKQVSTPLRDQRSDERFAHRSRRVLHVEDLSGVQDALWIERCLIRRISATFVGSSSARKYGFFVVSRCRARRRSTPPSSMPDGEQVEHELLACLSVVLEHREVHVAVSGVSAARNPRTVRFTDRRAPAP